MAKRFSFPLEALLRLREIREMERRRDVASALRAYNAASQKFKEVLTQGREAEAEMRRKLAGNINVTDLLLLDAYRNDLSRTTIVTSMEVNKKYGEYMASIDALVEARKRKRIVEMLKEIKFREWTKELIKEEADMLNEIGNRKKWGVE